MRLNAILPVIVLAICTATCGGDPAGPGNDGQPATGQVGPNGGTVEATFANGGALRLEVPPGALDSVVAITLTPLDPAGGAMASFLLEPAGLPFDPPASLTLELPDGDPLDASATVRFQSGLGPVFMASQVESSARRVTVGLRRLGFGSAIGTTQAALQVADGQAEGDLVDADYEERVGALQAAAVIIGQQGSLANAVAFADVVEGVLAFDLTTAAQDARVLGAIAAWHGVVCGQYAFAVSDLETYADAGGVIGLNLRVAAVMDWGFVSVLLAIQSAQVGGSGCPADPPGPVEVIAAKLEAFLPLVEAEIVALEEATQFSVILEDRLRPLMGLLATLSASEELVAEQERVLGFVAGQVGRMRLAAYASCAEDGTQIPQGRLLLLEAESDELQGVAPHTVADLQADIQLCQFEVTWKALNSEGAVGVEGVLAGGGTPGANPTTATLSLLTTDLLEFSGLGARSLRCPSGVGLGGDLVIRAVAGVSPPSSLVEREPATGGLYFTTPASVTAATLRGVTGAPLDETVQVTVELQREGNACGDDFLLTAHDAVLQLTVSLLAEGCTEASVAGTTGRIALSGDPCEPPPPPPPPGGCPAIRYPGFGADADSVAKLTCMETLLVEGGPVAFTLLTQVQDGLAVRGPSAGVTFPVLSSIGGGASFESTAESDLELSSLSQVEGGLVVRNMTSLAKLSIGGATITGGLVIELNPALTDIGGVSCGLTVTGGLVIRNNASLPAAVAQAKADCITADSKIVEGNGPEARVVGGR